MFPKLTRRLFISVVIVLAIVFVITKTRYMQQSISLANLRQLDYEQESYLAISVRTGKQFTKNKNEDAFTQRISNPTDSGESVGRHRRNRSRDIFNSTLLYWNKNSSSELEVKDVAILLEKRFQVWNQSGLPRPNARKYKNSYIFEDKPRVATAFKRFSQFQEDWCRVREARLNWEQYLAPCLNFTVWGVDMNGFRGAHELQTDAVKSYITLFDLRPAGEFSRFFIQTVTNDSKLKTVGGDSWRVHFRKGPSSFAPTVFDLDNGTYEVVFLVMEPGFYKADVILDYTLCNGFKDPPPDWFIRGNSQGKNQPDGILRGDKPYLLAPLRGGEQVSFEIVPSKDISAEYFTRKLESRVSRAPRGLGMITGAQRRCKVDCPSLVWDGFGSWTNRSWKPFSDDRPLYRKPKTKQSGILWIFGDSLANNFISALSSGPYRRLCTHVFTSCRVVYNWVYNMRGYWGDGVTHPREPLPDGKEYDHERVLRDVKEVLQCLENYISC